MISDVIFLICKLFFLLIVFPLSCSSNAEHSPCISSDFYPIFSTPISTSFSSLFSTAFSSSFSILFSLLSSLSSFLSTNTTFFSNFYGSKNAFEYSYLKLTLPFCSFSLIITGQLSGLEATMWLIFISMLALSVRRQSFWISTSLSQTRYAQSWRMVKVLGIQRLSSFVLYLELGRMGRWTTISIDIFIYNKKITGGNNHYFSCSFCLYSSIFPYFHWVLRGTQHQPPNPQSNTIPHLIPPPFSLG